MWVGIVLSIHPMQPLCVRKCDIINNSLGQEMKKILALRQRYLKHKEDNNRMKIHTQTSIPMKRILYKCHL